MSRALIVALMAAAVGCGGPAGDRSAEDFVNTTVPPFPDGLTSAGMMRLAPDAAGAYGLDLVFGPDRQMLWLGRLVGEMGARRVVAVLEIPREEPEVALIYSPGACRLDGEPDPEIVALARLAFAPTADQIVRAWRADRAAARFDPLPPDGIVCDNPRYPGGSEVMP